MIATESETRLPRFDPSFLSALTIYLFAALAMWVLIIQRTGEMSYTVDDAYIHAAIAKNISAHGTFGFIPGQFAATSSSILWTLLLTAIYAVAGQAWIPGILSILFGALTIERANEFLRTIGTGPLTRVIVLSIAMAWAPILPILSTGMEHTLHAWTIVGLFAAFAKIASSGKSRSIEIFIWAVLAAGARYESLFALPPMLIWLAMQRKWRCAFSLGFGMSIPVLGFAAYSMANGGYPLPNSLMMKGNIDDTFSIQAFSILLKVHYLWTLAILLIISTALCHFGSNPQLKKLMVLPLTVLAMILIHLQLAQLGWFWRYEGYLIILGAIAAAPLLEPLQVWLKKRSLTESISVFAILFVFCMPLFSRTVTATGQIVHAAGNIHDQQVQMAKVVQNLGPGASVAINDLGAVSFFTDARVPRSLWAGRQSHCARQA